MEFKYLKGPVKSRRLGRSLGINLLSDKICSFNCVYCEAGRTKKLTSERNEYVPVDEVIKELEEFLSKSPELDYITFAGTGEPVMNNRINDIILFIKQNYPEYKLALLTNASFFNDENIIDEIKDCDLIIPSLDAASNKVFKKINRPFKAINIDDIINGLIKLRKKFNGQIWLEIFIIEGLNDTEEELIKFQKVIGLVEPDRVQLNSLDRPPVESWVKPISENRLREIAQFIDRNVEVV